jgi:hypothetical protein
VRRWRRARAPVTEVTRSRRSLPERGKVESA